MKCRGCGFPFCPSDLGDKRGHHPDVTGLCIGCMERDRDVWKRWAREMAKNINAMADIYPEND